MFYVNKLIVQILKNRLIKHLLFHFILLILVLCVNLQQLHFFTASIHCFIRQKILESNASREMSTAAFHAATPKTRSPTARSLRMKNETAITMITGLKTGAQAKAERNEG